MTKRETFAVPHSWYRVSVSPCAKRRRACMTRRRSLVQVQYGPLHIAAPSVCAISTWGFPGRVRQPSRPDPTPRQGGESRGTAPTVAHTAAGGAR